MYQEFEDREVKLRTAYESLENGNFKHANSELSKYLKKNPLSKTAKALKALILLRSSKFQDAYQLMESLIAEFPTERGTLNIMLNFYKEIGQEIEMINYLQSVNKKFPDKEEPLICLFFMLVRKCDFDSQQLVARKLNAKKHDNKNLLFWVVISTVMQAENKPEIGKTVFLPLSQRMLEKALNDGLFERHIELQLYIYILKQLQKFDLALNIILRHDFISNLDKIDFKFDYSSEILDLNCCLLRWPAILQSAVNILSLDPDDWSAWQALLRHTFNIESKNGELDHQSEIFKLRLQELENVIQKFTDKYPSNRGPLLAKIDLTANLIHLEIDHNKLTEESAINLIRTYFENFGSRPICALDIASVMQLLIRDRNKSENFLTSILHQTEKESLELPASDANAINRRVCAFRLARSNGLSVKVSELLDAYQFHSGVNVRALSMGVDKIQIESGGSKEAEKATINDNDMLPFDGFLLLAVSDLMDPVDNKSNNVCSRIDLGCLLLAGHWLVSVGLPSSPANHFMRLRLISILSFAGGLCCPNRQLRELDILELRQVQLTSLGHLALTPGPHLTIWGQAIPSPNQSKLKSRSETQIVIDQSPVIDFYKHVIKKTQTMIAEAEEWLVGAYKQHAYTQIREFSLFLNQLRHSDTLVLAKTEFIYRKTLVLPNCFDDALERMGQASNDVKLAKTLLADIIDCRDFSTTPEFTWRQQEPANQIQTFEHIKHWIELRLNVVDLFGSYSKQIMQSVAQIESLESPNNASSEINDQNDQSIQECCKAIWNTVECLSKPDFTQFKYTDLLLTPESLLMSPPPLPVVSMSSAYFFGPYGETLKSCLKLISHFSAVAANAHSDLTPDTDAKQMFSNVIEPLSSMFSCQGEKEFATFPILPKPLSSTISSDQHPSAILLGLGIAVETFSLATLFISACVSMLRPRRFAHQKISSQSKKRNTKKLPEAKFIEETTNSNSKDQPCAVSVYLDQLAQHMLQVTIPTLETLCNQIVQIADSWANWCTTECIIQLTNCARQAAESALPGLPSKFSQWIPGLDNAPIFRDISNNLFIGFSELSAICGQKSLSIRAMKKELNYIGGVQINTLT